MKAIILAAGLGTRMGEVTRDKPKALVQVNGVPMLGLLIERLKKQGIKKFMVNVHHFGDQVINYIEKNGRFGVDISVSDERNELLDTGGAILKARDFFHGDEHVLVHNVDVLSDVNLIKLLNDHQNSDALASLVVRKRKSGRALLFDGDMQLTGWADLENKKYKWVNVPVEDFETFAYSGIYLATPSFAEKLPFTGCFSIIDALLKMAKTERIIGWPDASPVWFDLGTKEKIIAAEKYLKSNK
ncbi:MAG: NTP transferase domain-containing protein [Chlorobi bacterium]|nr:NTP transferase domain-containing protein [Chlorobiota bacterium]